MDQLPTLQQLEYLESGFEVSKILVHAGFSMEKPAFLITWGQIAEEIAHTRSDLRTASRSIGRRLFNRLGARNPEGSSKRWCAFLAQFHPRIYHKSPHPHGFHELAKRGR